MIEKMLDDRSKVEIILRNRLSEYITDKKLLDSILLCPEAQKLVDGVYKNRLILPAFVRRWWGSLLMSSLDQQPALKAQMSEIMAYLKPKELGSFFNMENSWGELWLVDEIAKQPEIINSMFNEKAHWPKSCLKNHQLRGGGKILYSQQTPRHQNFRKIPAFAKSFGMTKCCAKSWRQTTKFKTLDDFEQLVASRVNITNAQAHLAKTRHHSLRGLFKARRL